MAHKPTKRGPGRPRGRKCAARDCREYFEPLREQVLPGPDGTTQRVAYTGPPQRFCSEKCKWREQKRVQRERAAAAAPGVHKV